MGEILYSKIISEVTENLKNCIKPMLSAQEAADYIGVTINTLYAMTSKKLIPHYKPNGGKVFFKREEIDQWLQSNRIATESEAISRAEKYCRSNNFSASVRHGK